ncbi:uncharacterized protein N7473_012737 [Penicillium subrubescens]|nr:uncharacterized protein N7473_012737 [Penicillium subrubescens]KAJ5875390.1 hypothetical protein N7473_012737 [Penicillium subrubescens]
MVPLAPPTSPLHRPPPTTNHNHLNHNHQTTFNPTSYTRHLQIGTLTGFNRALSLSPRPRPHPSSPPSNSYSLSSKDLSTMPTPESAAFLAKKPTVAPTYEGVDFEDNVAVHNARDAIIREQWVRSMMARLVGEELGKCYAREGVNHLEKCGVLREKYFELLKERKVKGYLFQEKNYFGEANKSS